jgi:hypothetical protein
VWAKAPDKAGHAIPGLKARAIIDFGRNGFQSFILQIGNLQSRKL